MAALLLGLGVGQARAETGRVALRADLAVDSVAAGGLALSAALLYLAASAGSAGDPKGGVADVLVVAEATGAALVLSEGLKYAVGRQRPYAHFTDAARSADAIREDAFAGDLGATIEATLSEAGFSAVRSFQGYAIGAKPIQAPYLPCHGRRGEGERLAAGMILHVHVIAAAGEHFLRTRDDGWTMVTEDGRPSALFTAMVRVRHDGCDVLTPLLG